MSLSLNLRHIGDVVLVDMVGQVTLGDGSVILREGIKALVEKGVKKITLNMSDVSYVDASGVGELVFCQATISNGGGKLALLNPADRLKAVLQANRLEKIFDFFNDEKKAVESFQ